MDQLLQGVSHKWLVTGVAGFIGSNILEYLLKNHQVVVGLDDFSTGYRKNLDEIRSLVKEEDWRRFQFIEGDIRDYNACREAAHGVAIVLHQAALGSVPRSVKDPITTNSVNVDGFLNMLTAARDCGVQRFVYAASSSTYGDHPALPKVEHQIGNPLSPYAVTKYVNELYADVFGRTYNTKSIGLRYFNVFGARQDPDGAYAAVIPKWIAAFLRGDDVFINGDGETSRDFCYVKNAVEANIKAAMVKDGVALNQVYNIAVGERTTLKELFFAIREVLAHHTGKKFAQEPSYLPFREGDVRHSQADISKARNLFGYAPQYRIADGLKEAIGWYLQSLGS